MKSKRFSNSATERNHFYSSCFLIIEQSDATARHLDGTRVAFINRHKRQSNDDIKMRERNSAPHVTDM